MSAKRSQVMCEKVTFGTCHHYVSPESTITFKHLQYPLSVVVNVMHIVWVSVRNVDMLWITRSFSDKLMIVKEYDRTKYPLLFQRYMEKRR